MLAIRLQRTGRSGHPEYRMIVQDSHRSPTSGKVVANLGNYNPHTKALNINKERAEFYVKNGAQPSPRVAKLLKEDGLKLPSWVVFAEKKTKTIRNIDKLRRNRPAEEVKEEEPVAEAEEPTDAETAAEATESPVAVEETAPAEAVEAPVATETAPATEEVATEPSAEAEAPKEA